VKRQGRARKELGSIASTLLIVVGTTGLIIYALYLENPNNIALHYTLIALVVVGELLAFTLAILYLTGRVEHQGGIEQPRTWSEAFLSFSSRHFPSGIELKH
jgi:hypothetical protein